MISKGFVGVFAEPLGKAEVSAFVRSWIERFEKVEQVPPRAGHEISTLSVASEADIMWEDQLQFRVLNGQDFAWIYLTLNRSVVETSGLPADEISLCLDVLMELPGLEEVVDDRNDRRLNELEAEGLW